MKKVLIITYYFPPHPAIGSLRPSGLAGYLPEFGWQPVVLTPELPGRGDTGCDVIETPYRDLITLWKKRLRLRTDASLEAQLGISERKDSASLIEKLSLPFKDLVLCPDSQVGWLDDAIDAAGDLLLRESVDAIISTSKPETCHLIARTLSRRYSIPWVADFRDLWTQNAYFSHTRPRRVWERRMECRTLRHAHALTTVSSPLADALSALHTGREVCAIPNGFDDSEMNLPPSPVSRKFSITYTGNLYQGKRDPLPLFLAIRDLIDEGVMDPSVLDVNLYCPVERWLEDEIREHGLDGIVRLPGIVPRDLALEKQKESQILLLLLWNNPEERGVYTGKVFEYLAACRPILAVNGPAESVVSDLLAETAAGVYAGSLSELKRSLADCFREYRRTGAVTYTGIPEELMKYSQRRMAERFSEILDRITGNLSDRG